jgi:hypothetical protein
MSIAVRTPYAKYMNAENNLKSLVDLKSTHMTGLWNKYNLLTCTNSKYLIASHFRRGVSWYVNTKWQMFKTFNRALKDGKDPQEIMESIGGAIQDQRRIVSLKKLNVVLMDRAKMPQEKTKAYRDIERQDRDFFDEIKHGIWVAHGENPSAGLDFGDKIIESEPDGPLQAAVLKTMLRVLKEGYVNTKQNPSFFRNLKV